MYVHINKKIVYIILLVLISSSIHSQNKEESNYDDIYIYVKNDRFIGDVLGYKAYFSLYSPDERFQADNYYFKIDFRSLDYESLYNLGKPINIDSINYIDPYVHFKGKTNCDLHTELSLYKRIYIITDIPHSRIRNKEDKKHIIWHTTYAGTLKNIVHTNMTGKILLED